MPGIGVGGRIRLAPISLSKEITMSRNISLLLLYLLTLAPRSAEATWIKTVSTPYYQQQDALPLWSGCGAATAKMIIDSDPIKGTSKTLAEYRTAIEAHRAGPPTPATGPPYTNGFYTDPVAMEWVIEEYDTRGEPPAQNRWIIDSRADTKEAAAKLAWTIDKYGTPSATLVYEGGHWVAVTGVRTSSQPTKGKFTTERIRINDPDKLSTIGHNQWISYETWSKSYQTKNKYGTTYLDKLVSVIDPDAPPDEIGDYTRVQPGAPLTANEALSQALTLLSLEGLHDEFLGLTPKYAELVYISQTTDLGWWVGFVDSMDLVHGGMLIDQDQYDLLIAGWGSSENDFISWDQRALLWPYLGNRIPTAGIGDDTSGLFYITPVPEPSSIVLLFVGFIGLGLVSLRNKKT